MEQKKCNKCNEIKFIKEFVKDKSAKGGHRNFCKQCYNLSKRKTPIPKKPKEGYKFCAMCKEEKMLGEFNQKYIQKKWRYYSYCKPCELIQSNNRYAHECKMCGKKYRTGQKNTTYCKKCHNENFLHTYSILSTLDWSGEKNPMYGVQRFGKDNPNYKPEITDEERELGRLLEGYGVWRREVYERDNYTCQICGSNQGGTLVAHHKDGYHWCKKRRVDVSNGITLCENCHDEFHSIYGKRNNTEKQFLDFSSFKKKS